MFTFDGVTSSTMNINVNRYNVNAIPELNNYFMYIDRKDGVYDFGSNFKEKYITFSCNFLPQTSLANAMALIDNLNKYFNPKNGLKTLILDSLPTRQYYARLANSLDFEMLIRTGAQFELTFVCPDPFAYATSGTNHQYTANGIYTVNVPGTAPVRPVLTLIATIQEQGDNLVINFNNTDVIEVRPVMETTYKLVIDCENYTAKYINIATEAESNGLQYIEKLAFPELKVGDNSLEITEASAYTTITSLDIDYYARYF